MLVEVGEYSSGAGSVAVLLRASHGNRARFIHHVVTQAVIASTGERGSGPCVMEANKRITHNSAIENGALGNGGAAA